MTDDECRQAEWLAMAVEELNPVPRCPICGLEYDPEYDWDACGCYYDSIFRD